MVNLEFVVYIQRQALFVNGLGIENQVLNPLYQAELSNIVGYERRVSPLLPMEACVNLSPYAWKLRPVK